MALGVVALERYQSGTEVTPGTGVAATRIDYVNPGAFLKDDIEFHKPDEARNSYERNYRSFPTKRHPEITGMTWDPTFQGVVRYMQAGLKGGVTGGSGDSGTPEMFTYTFKPTLTSNDLKHLTWEVGDNITAWQVAGCVLQRFEYGFTADGPMTGSMDWIGLSSVPASFTAALSDTVPEDIIGAQAIVYIDSSTIGSTAAAYPMGLTYSVDNGYQELYVLNGNLTPKEHVRGQKRFAALEGRIAFDSLTEYNKFVPATRGERKIRVKYTGANIHDSVPSTFALDWYGFWDAYDLGTDGGLHVASLKGESHYNTGFGGSHQIVVETALETIP